MFLFENLDTHEKVYFKDWDEYTKGTGTHWKTIQLKNNNGQTVKCKLGKGKIWRQILFHNIGEKCLECKNKSTHYIVNLCRKHLDNKISQHNGEYFHPKESLSYKGHQIGQLYCLHDGEVYKRGVDVDEKKE